jgi:hypothetical protein
VQITLDHLILSGQRNYIGKGSIDAKFKRMTSYDASVVSGLVNPQIVYKKLKEGRSMREIEMS